MPEGDERGGLRHDLVRAWIGRCERRLANNRAELEGAGTVGESWALVKRLWGGH